MGPRLDQLKRHLLAFAMLRAFIFAAVLQGPARADPGSGVADWLQPGNRAALGLGGDPFLSPFEDDIGWWSEVPNLQRTRIRTEVVGREPISPGMTGDHGELSSSEVSWSATGPVHLLGRKWSLAARLASPRWDGSWRGSSSAVSLERTSTYAAVGLRAQDLLPGLSLQSTLPVWWSTDEASRSRFRLGLRQCLAGRFTAQVSWGRGRMPEIVRSTVEGEPVEASLNLSSDDRSFGASLDLPLRLRVEGALRRSDFEESTQRSKEPRYHFSPGGRLETSEAGIVWGRSNGFRVVGRTTQGNLDVLGNASWGGQRFGRLDYVHARVRSALAGVQIPIRRNGRVLVDVESVRLEGTARADVQSWPFTPTIIDLLGTRRIAKAEFKARWTRAHAGADVDLGSTRLLAGFAFYDVYPGLYVESWRPTFLLFGRSDLRVDELSLQRLQLGAVSLGMRLKAASLEVWCGAQQFVPLRMFERLEPGRVGDRGGSEAAAGVTEAGAKPRSWPSGTAFQVVLTHWI